jgi:hypothetical protein
VASGGSESIGGGRRGGEQGGERGWPNGRTRSWPPNIGDFPPESRENRDRRTRLVQPHGIFIVMLFLVISEPRPEPPSSVTAQRQRYWQWIAPLQTSGEVRSVHAKVGRGAVVLFDVASNEHLHRRLNEWAEIIPACFAVHALIDPDVAQAYLRQG